MLELLMVKPFTSVFSLTFPMGKWLCLILLLSCSATKTYYVPDESNGFSDSMISDTVYTISVNTKNFDKKDIKRVEDIFYLRAAEIAKEKGYPFFYTADSIDSLSDMNSKTKPFKRKIYTLAVYQTLRMSGIVKLLEEKPKDATFRIFNTEYAYQQRKYLIIERENILGKTDKTDNGNAIDDESSKSDGD